MIEAVEAKSAARILASIWRFGADWMGRSRVGRAVLAGLRATARSLGQTLHRLWLEVTGFTFLAIAAIGAVAGVHEYGKYQSHANGPGRLLLAVVFTASFAWFGASSFWRVKRNGQGQQD
jgi:hypothetical protein